MGGGEGGGLFKVLPPLPPQKFFNCTLDDTLYHPGHENLDTILSAADTEKAFDSVEHDFIFATLAKFGFTNDYIQKIKTLLYTGSSCIMNNGFSTGYFSLHRGARQGDSLSPFIYHALRFYS